MEPSGRDLSSQFQNFSNQLREIDQDPKLDSTGKFFKKIEELIDTMKNAKINPYTYYTGVGKNIRTSYGFGRTN